jgi:hypothetical protein
MSGSSRHSRLAATLAFALLAALTPAPAPAAAPLQAIDPLQSATVAAMNVAAPAIASTRFVITGPPRASEPFPIVDPATGKPVSPSATIVNRANGKSVNAGQYWALVNQFEAALNATGHSLRDGLTAYDLGRLAGSSQSELEDHVNAPAATVSGISSVDPSIPLGALRGILDKRALSTPLGGPQGASSTATPPPAAATATGRGAIINCSLRGLKCGAPLSPLPPSVTNGDGTVSAVDVSWSPSYGDPSDADVYLNTLFSVGGKAGSNSPVDLQGKVAIGGHILGAGGDLASATASVANNTASYNVVVAGSSISSGSVQGTTTTKKYPTTFLDETVPVPVGPVTVTLEVTAGGEIDLTYTLLDEGNTATAALEPEFKVNASFSIGAGLDLGIISGTAGVSGNLQVADVSFNPAEMQLGFTESQSKTGITVQGSVYACQLQYALSIKVQENHTFLAGNASVFVKGCIDYILSSSCDTFSHQLFNWSGIRGSDTLVDKSVSTNVGPVYSDLPEYGKALPAGAVFSADDSSGMPAACHNFGFPGPGTQLQNAQ